MVTEKLYWVDPYMVEFDADVIDVKEVSGGYAHLLDRTAFYPGGGGLPADRGTLNDNEVTDMWEDGEGIWHVTSRRLSGRVRGVIDFTRRYRYMTVHTAQHLISAIAYRIFGVQTLSMHLSEDGVSYIVFDGEFDMESLMNAAWDAIGRAPVVRWRLIGRDEPLPPMRRSVRWEKVKGDAVRLVEIEGYDVVPCGGLHVKRLSEVAPLVPVGVSKKKGKPALEYLAGPGAREYLLGITNELKSLRTEVQQLRSELSSMERKIKVLKAEEMAGQLPQRFGIVNLDDAEILTPLAKKLAQMGKVGVLVSVDRFAVVGDEDVWHRIRPVVRGGGGNGLWFGKIADPDAFKSILKGGDEE